MDDCTVITTTSTDSEFDDCRIHSIEIESKTDPHIDLIPDNIMVRDFFVSEIQSDHKDTDGRAHFDMGSQMTTTNNKELLYG